MTSFQRFQRNHRTQVSSQYRSSYKSQPKSSDPNLSSLVTFSSQQIRLRYNPQDRLGTYSLKITNETGYKIHFKVRSNNPTNYLVSPFEEVIANRSDIFVNFEFTTDTDDLSAYRRDKFEIIWGKVPYQPDEVATLTESRIFPVVFAIVESNAKPNIGSSPIFSADEKPAANYYPSSLKPAKLNALPSNSSEAPSSTLLTKQNIIWISVVSFLIGFIFT